MKLRHLILLSLAAMPSAWAATPEGAPVLAERGETAAAHDARMAWFRDAHFGMFIHWGLYSQAGGLWNGKDARFNNCAEWLMFGGKVPVKEYATLAKDFNPTRFDARAWVRAAKAAGMKYVVFTAKHHDGFAMFKTKASPFNIIEATPFKRDPLKDIAEACREEGLKFGIYYSQNLDWHHPGGGGGPPAWPMWDPAQKGDGDRYVDEIVIPQLRELLTNYGEVSMLWFDIGHHGITNKVRCERIQKAVLACAPKIIINNRLGGGVAGDIETPEQHIPPMGLPGRDWESCMTMNKTWGFAKSDHDWKSSRKLIQNLADITSKGGNFLLNIGPDELGQIPEPSLERLRDIGQWMKVNGEAIDGVRASVFPVLPKWGRVTTRVNRDGSSTLYAIVFDAPADGVLTLPGLENQVTGAALLGGGEAPKVESGHGVVSIKLPASCRQRQDFVVAIKVKGTPKVDIAARPDGDGTIRLSPKVAITTGGLAVPEIRAGGLGGFAEEHLASWKDLKAVATWQVQVSAANEYQIKARLAAPQAAEGSVIEFVCGSQVLPHTVKATGGWVDFGEQTIDGVLRLPAGASEITARVKSRKGSAPCNLGVITLIPTKK